MFTVILWAMSRYINALIFLILFNIYSSNSFLLKHLNHFIQLLDCWSDQFWHLVKQYFSLSLFGLGASVFFWQLSNGYWSLFFVRFSTEDWFCNLWMPIVPRWWWHHLHLKHSKCQCQLSMKTNVSWKVAVRFL